VVHGKGVKQSQVFNVINIQQLSPAAHTDNTLGEMTNGKTSVCG